MDSDTPRSSKIVYDSSHTTPMVENSCLSSPTLSDDSVPALQLTPESEASVELFEDLDAHTLPDSSTESQASVELVDDWDAHVNSPTLSSPTSSTNSDSTDSTNSVDMVTATMEELDKLTAFNIHLSSTDMPAELRAFIHGVIYNPRSASSPAAQRIGEASVHARRAREGTASAALVEHLLFSGEGQAPGGGEKYIYRDDQAPLSATYIPIAPTTAVKKRYNALSSSTCDYAIGYVTERTARDQSVGRPDGHAVALAFDKDDDSIAVRTRSCRISIALLLGLHANFNVS